MNFELIKYLIDRLNYYANIDKNSNIVKEFEYLLDLSGSRWTVEKGANDLLRYVIVEYKSDPNDTGIVNKFRQLTNELTYVYSGEVLDTMLNDARDVTT